ncbi:MAG: hypothetical protein ABJP70_12760 [Erythrobacter sp.]
MNASAASSNQAPSRQFAFRVPEKSATFWLYALIGLLAVMHVSMVTGRSINWDEFWFYGQVETVARGEFMQPLQTIHTRFFFWLPAMAGSEIDHILIARIFMLACLSITATGIYAVAQKFSDHRTALLAAAAYLAAGFTLQHGASFRVDPIVTALLTTSLAIAARTRLSAPTILALGALIGLAAMVTIKFVLWAPAFAGIALYRWEDENWNWQYLARWVAAGAVALGVFALLYTFHSSGAAETFSASDSLNGSANKMFGLAGQAQMLIALKGIFTALPLMALIAFAPWVILRKNWTWQRKLALLCIWLPVLTPLFYRNAWPYFYVFILPPVAIVAALSIPAFVNRYGRASAVAAIAGFALLVWALDTRGVTQNQRQVNAAVHQAFPEPVNYFDCCGMIGTFRKQNRFRTSWGIENYLAVGRPTLLETMREIPVPLMLDNKREFVPIFEGETIATLHSDDVAALRNTYIALWGDIYVAGRSVEPGTRLDWDVLVPGTYKVQGQLVINGREIAEGGLIKLPRGINVLENLGSNTGTLIWGAETRVPDGDEPEEYWTMF